LGRIAITNERLPIQRRAKFEDSFGDHALCWLTSMPTIEENWNHSLQVLEGRSNYVNAVAFSPDG